MLLRGDVVAIRAWLRDSHLRRVAFNLVWIIIGTGMFGLAVGAWRAPAQALYTGLKLPLIVLLTTCANGLLNGMLAPLLGLQVGFRQSFLAILMSFSIAAMVLGALSPVIWFLIWNAPPLGSNESRSTHSVILLTLVFVIAFAGVAGNLRLLRLVRAMSGNATIAWRTVVAWLAGNLLLGSQLAWILRPFVGSPNLPVQFLREDALRGNFFESVYNAVQRLLQ
jgi:hypothetical protein